LTSNEKKGIFVLRDNEQERSRENSV